VANYNEQINGNRLITPVELAVHDFRFPLCLSLSLSLRIHTYRRITEPAATMREKADGSG